MQEYVVMLWNFLLQLLYRINRPHFLRVYKHNKSTWDFRRTLELLVNHWPLVRDLQDFSRILLALRMSLRGNFQQVDWLLYFNLIMKMHEMSCKRLTYFKIVPNLTISHRLVWYRTKKNGWITPQNLPCSSYAKNKNPTSCPNLMAASVNCFLWFSIAARCSLKNSLSDENFSFSSNNSGSV